MWRRDGDEEESAVGEGKGGRWTAFVKFAINAKATLSKVSIGEADASIVYVTDVKAAKGTTGGVRIPDTMNVIATYPMAVVKQSQNQAAAKAWEQFVTSKDGQKTLRKFGFLPP